jgi:hypothetical protein
VTVFEFLSVSVSIVLALTLGKLIASTPHVFASSARDSIHAGFFLVTTFVVLAIWWFVWTLNDKETWNFLEFLLMMGSPIGLYLAAHVLVSDTPAEVSSWRDHFQRIRRWYFAAILATIVFAALRTTWVFGADFTFAVGLSVLGIAFLIGIISDHRAIHAGVLVFWLLFQIFAISQRFTAA